MKEQLKTYKEDITIILEAIENGDLKDAVKMLKDLREDLEILTLMCWF